MSWLTTKGQNIIDGEGRCVLLKGMGLGSWHLPEGYMFSQLQAPYNSPRGMEALSHELIGPDASKAFWATWRETFFTAADAQAIAEGGCNSIRLALDWRHLFTDEDHPQPIQSGLALVDRVIDNARAAGLWSILDLHAAPGGQNGTNIDNGWGHPWLFASDRCWHQAIVVWRELARRYKDRPEVAGYDLLNEPLPEVYRDLYYPRLLDFYRECIAAIREVDARHIVILEGANWSTDYSMITEKLDEHVVYGFHKYWNATDTASIQHFLDLSRRDDAPLWCGETGENDLNWYRETGALLEKHNIGWNIWPYKRMANGEKLAPFIIQEPTDWKQVKAYSKTGNYDDRPSLAAARQAFAELAQACRLENCSHDPRVLDAWFGRLSQQ
jgi:aryl-phospho-beta-D-glucosidase BglC (GH1 family)